MYSCAGPREAIGAPRTAVPPLACDCHAHVVGPAAEYPLVADRSFTPPEAHPAAYRLMLESLGAERCVIVQPSIYGTDNRRTVSAIGEFGLSRARGIAMVGHDVGKAELRRLHAAGIRGTRFITVSRGGPALEQLPAVAAKIADFGWHIEMYVPPAIWPDILPVIAGLPVPVVLDHMGGFPADTDRRDPSFDRLLDLTVAGRCWVKLCGYRNSLTGYPYGDLAALARQFVEIAPERCVWGSDWPHFLTSGTMPGDDELLDLLADWVPDEALRHGILVSNPAALYDF